MKGHVVAKFGQHIARVAIAGFLEGLGDAMTLGQQEFTYGVNTGVRTGQFKDTDADTLAKAGKKKERAIFKSFDVSIIEKG